MSERSEKTFIEAMDAYPEIDDDETMDEVEDESIFRSSMIDLIDTLGNPEFKFIYPILIKDIETTNIQNKQLFCETMLEKIEEIYDFKFSEKPEIETEYSIKQCLEFIKFLQFNNTLFLSYVWQYMNVDLLKLNIEIFSKNNDIKILKEVEEQLDTHEQPEMISLFLRTYYKEKFIDWFIEQTKRNKIDIIIEILEREGKLNNKNK